MKFFDRLKDRSTVGPKNIVPKIPSRFEKLHAEKNDQHEQPGFTESYDEFEHLPRAKKNKSNRNKKNTDKTIENKSLVREQFFSTENKEIINEQQFPNDLLKEESRQDELVDASSNIETTIKIKEKVSENIEAIKNKELAIKEVSRPQNVIAKRSSSMPDIGRNEQVDSTQQINKTQLNPITITIGKLEIKAIKQNKTTSKKSRRTPNLTLDQYIKNKSRT